MKSIISFAFGAVGNPLGIGAEEGSAGEHAITRFLCDAIDDDELISLLPTSCFVGESLGVWAEGERTGADVILVSGGMSVDPDDKTPEGIRRSGAKVETHGFPVLPGSMFVMAYLDETPVMGLSGCVLHDPFTAFDALLPRLLAGEKITRAGIMAMGHGGLQRKHDH